MFPRSNSGFRASWRTARITTSLAASMVASVQRSRKPESTKARKRFLISCLPGFLIELSRETGRATKTGRKRGCWMGNDRFSHPPQCDARKLCNSRSRQDLDRDLGAPLQVNVTGQEKVAAMFNRSRKMKTVRHLQSKSSHPGTPSSGASPGPQFFGLLLNASDLEHASVPLVAHRFALRTRPSRSTD
jgi:hypothetical protein